jgi:hypothetical protein
MKLLEMFFNKKGQNSYKEKDKDKERSIIDSFTAAGCVFTNGTHILGGYQPNKDIPYISGFGGSRLEGETFERTAVREMIEELFDIEVTGEMIKWILKIVTPSRTIKHTGYMILQYSFQQLDEIMKYLEPYGEDSGLYKVWPKNLGDLIFKRTPKPSSEVSTLCILPFVKGLTIDEQFKNDIEEMCSV